MAGKVELGLARLGEARYGKAGISPTRLTARRKRLNYEWKPGVGVFAKYDAQKVGEELERIPVLKPQYVVEYAEKHKGAELHKCLEWDNAKAAKAWRKQQASDILRLIIVVETVKLGNKTSQIKIRAFENASDENNGSVYLPTKKALENPEYRECILESIRRGIEELSEKGKKYAAIINDSAAYQKGLEVAIGAISPKRPGSRKKTA
jgi:hypothetical protein